MASISQYNAYTTQSPLESPPLNVKLFGGILNLNHNKLSSVIPIFEHQVSANQWCVSICLWGFQGSAYASEARSSNDFFSPSLVPPYPVLPFLLLIVATKFPVVSRAISKIKVVMMMFMSKYYCGNETPPHLFGYRTKITNYQNICYKILKVELTDHSVKTSIVDVWMCVYMYVYSQLQNIFILAVYYDNITQGNVLLRGSFLDLTFPYCHRVLGVNSGIQNVLYSEGPILHTEV